MFAPAVQIFAPQEGPQRLALANTSYELLYGGAKGGGKTMWAVLLPTRYVDLGRYRALILRRETKDLGDILDKSGQVYQACFDCNFRANHPLYPPHWLFASGARVALSHCHDQEDWQRYEGQEYQTIIFDELTQFTEKQYNKISQRLRGIVPGLPTYVRFLRATATPEGRYRAWVYKRFAPWLSQKYEHELLPARSNPVTGKPIPPAASGQVLWFKRNDHGQEDLVPPGTPRAQSRCFIRARLEDNRLLEEADPLYRQILENLDPVSRAQALDGEWDVKEAKGEMFPRDRWQLCHRPPSPVIIAVRFWDLGASQTGDWCSGTKIGLCRDGQIILLDHGRRRGQPDDIDNFVLSQTRGDDPLDLCRIEQEPGAGSKLTIAHFMRTLAGRDVAGVPESGKGSKVMRARPLSAAQRNRRVYVIVAPWNEELFDEMEDFPIAEHDDQVDSASGAFLELCKLEDFASYLRDRRDIRATEKHLTRAFDLAGLGKFKAL